MARQRFRRFNTGIYCKDQDIKNETCMAARAGNLISLRRQRGFTLEGGCVAHGDATAQADDAMRNVDILLEEAGSKMAPICKMTTCITGRVEIDINAVIPEGETRSIWVDSWGPFGAASQRSSGRPPGRGGVRCPGSPHRRTGRQADRLISTITPQFPQ